MRTEMDYLVLGNFLINKKEQKIMHDNIDWMNEYKLD